MKPTRPPRWRVANIRRDLDDSDEVVVDRAAHALGVVRKDIVDWEVSRRSIDARGRRAPRFVVSLDITLDEGFDGRIEAGGQISVVRDPVIVEAPEVSPDSARPVVLGMGPCGLFAALQLAEAGLRPVVIDRGRPVEARAKDVSRLMGRGEINPDSNLCFGEGGAGTWSDGKLYTRVGGRRVREVIETLAEMGGPDRILVDARPHLGTDRLVAVLKRFRAALVALGCELRFDTRVDSLRVEDGRATGVVLADGEVIDATHVVLALGHSARDLYRSLTRSGVVMQPKPFAVGFRLEHPQALINELQYGQWHEHPALPAAYYELSANLDSGRGSRGVYSFCMCPGGSVVPTPTREGEVCVNGMSHAARSGRYANSAVVVTVDPADFGRVDPSYFENDEQLAGIGFQRQAEARAWELGGGEFIAPAQRLVDYMSGRASVEVRRTTYKRGVRPAELDGCYPDFVNEALRAAVRTFDGRMRGYLSAEAVLIGVETRTSAPVTIVRDRDSCESATISGLYPAGEGAGYGGGIVSAAIDGIRVAESILAEVSSAPLTA